MRSKFKWIFTLLLAFTMQFSFAQEKTITGTVSDDGGALPGANVVVKGTTKSTTTGFDGKYSIKASVGEILVFSFVGLPDNSQTVGALNTINVKLATSVLDVVVVTGLNVKRKQDAITSSYTLVKSEELNRASAPNAVQALIGKVSGLQINTTNSNVAGENRVVFRGVRSLSGNNQALVVIDGAISTLTTLQQIPPESILSLNAMKGAQGAAIYGSDGVNGVIVVTTKKGSGDKISVNFKSSLDISEIAYTPTRQLRYGQGWDGSHSNIENGSWGPEFDGSLQPVGVAQPDGTFIVAPYSPNKNSIKEFFNSGLLFQNGLTISGGTPESGYINFSANRQANEFVVKGDELKRNAFLLKAGKNIGKFTLGLNLNYITQNVKQAGTDLYGDLLQSASNIPIPLFQNGNGYNWTVYADNPYWLRDNVRENSKSDIVAAIADFGYKFNKNISVSYLGNLRLNLDNNLDYSNKFDDLGYNETTYGSAPDAINASLLSSTEFRRRFYGDLIVNFDYKLTENIGLKALVGNNIQDDYIKSNEAGGINFAIPEIYNYSNVLNPYTAGQRFTNRGFSATLDNDITQRRKVGVFGSVDLDYKEYLFLTLTGRNDWSSTFVKSANGFFYPSAGFAFVPTKAFESIKGKVLNYVKISGNVTKVGNDSGVGTYGINERAATGFGYPFDGANSYVQITNPTFKFIRPEFVTTKEASINLGFFNDRLTLDGSYYIQDTNDLITNTSLSRTTGYNSINRNAGSLQTKGFEIDLGFTPIKSSNSRGFRWDNKVNYTHYKTIVTSLTDGLTSVSLRSPFAFAGVFAELGEEFPLFKGNVFAKDGQGRTILDINGNPTFDPIQQKLGTSTPDYIVGLTSSFSFKGFKLSSTMDYRTGHKFFSDTKRSLSANGSTIESAENRGGYIMPNSTYDYNGDGVYSANETNTTVVSGGASTASYITFNNGFLNRNAEYLVLDATAFKIREASLSYSFSDKMISKAGLSALSVGVNARNPLALFSKQNRNYADPEASETTGNAAGLELGNRYPAQKSYGFSLNLTF